MITEMVSFRAGGRTLAAYTARPEGSGPFPGVLVIHEAWGLNENIKEIARRFAGEGYAALAVDLHRHDGGFLLVITENFHQHVDDVFHEVHRIVMDDHVPWDIQLGCLADEVQGFGIGHGG
jgi:dienelactone hydrolase